MCEETSAMNPQVFVPHGSQSSFFCFLLMNYTSLSCGSSASESSGSPISCSLVCRRGGITTPFESVTDVSNCSNRDIDKPVFCFSSSVTDTISCCFPSISNNPEVLLRFWFLCNDWFWFFYWLRFFYWLWFFHWFWLSRCSTPPHYFSEFNCSVFLIELIAVS